MKITDLKCAIIGRHPIIRITTDEGLVGWYEKRYPMEGTKVPK